jgi:3-oxoacyl-[acyl-carrier protein] reductase
MALALARVGARVAMNFMGDEELAARAFADLEAVGGEHCLLRADVTDERSIVTLCGTVADRIGPIDILVPNATCAQPELPIEQYDWAFFQRMLDFFVKSPALLTKACLPHMREQRWGRIVHITSEVVQVGNPNFSAYVAAKGGQTGFARSTAREFGPFGITVNMVAPGWIPVERHADVPQQVLDDHRTTIPVGEFGKPVDVAGAVVYLASDEARFVTGQTITVNGGRTVF